MVPLLLVLLQAPQAAPPPVELPVSLERVRQGLARPGRFDSPQPRPWRRPLFRSRVDERLLFEAPAWEDTSVVPPWVRPTAPTYHYEFLSMVTPEEVRGATLYPCCNVGPLIDRVGDMVTKGVRAIKHGRAKREVERVMRDAGIKKD